MAIAYDPNTLFASYNKVMGTYQPPTGGQTPSAGQFYRSPVQALGESTVAQPESQPTQQNNNQFNLPWDKMNDWQRSQVQQSQGPSIDDLRNEQRSAIEGGYNNYFSELDAMLGELPTQKGAQEGIVGSQYTQGVADLGAEKELGLADLGQQRIRTEGNQSKNLADLSENIRNMFTSGQVKLGGMGAGDSSAVNQYSYALTKLGSKARGDVMGKTADIMSEIDNREFKLNTIFSNEKGRLGRERDDKINQIAQWFSEQTRDLQGRKGEALRAKGQDLAGLTQGILDQAIRAAEQAQTAYLNRQTALDQWAINQSNTIGEVRKNLASVASYQPSLPGTPQVNGQISQGVTGSLSQAPY